MPDNPKEQEDLATLQMLLNQTARNAMDALRHMADLDADGLRHSGHKDNASAVLSTYRYYQKQIDSAIKAHLKKYPD